MEVKKTPPSLGLKYSFKIWEFKNLLVKILGPEILNDFLILPEVENPASLYIHLYVSRDYYLKANTWQHPDADAVFYITRIYNKLGAYEAEQIFENLSVDKIKEIIQKVKQLSDS